MRSVAFCRAIPFLLLSISALLTTQVAESVEATEEKPAESTVSFWESSGDGKSISLIAFQQSNRINSALDAQTQVEGICIHCQLSLTCRIGDLAKRCAVCPCGMTNSVCLSGKKAAEKNWILFLQNMPRGTRLRVEYANPCRPEEGLKRLKIDFHGVLLPIEGIAGAIPDQVQSLGKSVGATHTELNSEKSRLQLSLKDNWTADKEARLEKGLAKLGAKVSAAPENTVAP